MKHTTAFGLLVAGVLAAFACTDLPTSDSDTQLRAKAAGAQRVGVMTQNLYVGTDVDAGVPVVLALEFLSIIEAQLAARGLHYTVAATVKNIDVTPVPGIQLVDYDAILVNTDLATVRSEERR